MHGESVLWKPYKKSFFRHFIKLEFPFENQYFSAFQIPSESKDINTKTNIVRGDFQKKNLQGPVGRFFMIFNERNCHLSID